ncbi:MAG: hypothetical protein PVJ33_17430 [Lysobacterales bacterium]
MDQQRTKAPFHLWIVAILAILWNAVGCFDYSATEMRMDSYMSRFTQEQLDYFYAFPSWVIGAWAIAVWGSLLASFGLLLRKAWSMWLFGLAIIGLAATTVYNFVLSNGSVMMGEDAVTFTVVIWVIALFLYFYSQAMAKRKVLT